MGKSIKIICRPFIYIIILLLPSQGFSQYLSNIWSMNSESDLWQISSDFTISSNDNIYLSGNYNGDSKFGSYRSNGTQDIFIAKFNELGHAEWINYYYSNGYSHVSSIEVSQDNIYISGYFKGVLQLGEVKLESLKNESIFISSIDKSGKVNWAKQISGNFLGQDIHFVPMYNKLLALSTTYKNKIRFDETHTLQSKKNANIFIALIDSTGKISKAIMSEGEGNKSVTSLTVSLDNKIYFGGYFDKEIRISNSLITTNGGKDGFIYCLDSSLNVIYSKQVGSIYDDRVESIAIDRANFLITTGNYSESIDCENLQLPSTKGGSDAFIIKLDNYGSTVWSDCFGGISNDYVNSLAINKMGTCYISGSFRGSIDKLGQTINSKDNNKSLFIAKYSYEGKFQAIDSISRNKINFNRKLKIDDKDYLILAGNFINGRDSIQSKEIPNNFNLSKFLDCDSRIKLALPSDTMLCNDHFLIKADTIFSYYLWNTDEIKPDILVTNSGEYYLTVIDDAGCKSRDTINVILNNAPAFSFGDTIILEKDETYALWGPENMKDYLWNDGSTLSFNIIKGENIACIKNISLQVVDTKGCKSEAHVVIDNRGIDSEIGDSNQDFQVSVYPLPANNKLNLKITNPDQNYNVLIELISDLGMTIIESEVHVDFIIMNATLDVETIPNGNYILHITNGNMHVSKHIVIMH